MKYKTKIIDGYEVTFSDEWVHSLENQEHWMFYWNQASLVNENIDKNDKILEVGVGTKFLSNYLKSKNYNIRTLDIDSGKKPDYVSDALSFNYSEVNPDAIVAFEIFEHIPYPTFEKIIEKLAKQKIQKIMFSVPKCKRRLFSIQIKIPFFNKINIEPRISYWKIVTPAHFWEISQKTKKSSNNKDLISEKSIFELFEKYNYSLNEVKRVNNLHFYMATYTQ